MFMNKVTFTWTYKPLTLCATHLGFNPFNVSIPKVAIPIFSFEYKSQKCLNYEESTHTP